MIVAASTIACCSNTHHPKHSRLRSRSASLVELHLRLAEPYRIRRRSEFPVECRHAMKLVKLAGIGHRKSATGDETAQRRMLFRSLILDPETSAASGGEL